jgi:ribosomal protein S18 acetylase RimI-like enzyme
MADHRPLSHDDDATLPVAIRPVRPADLDAVVELDASVFGSPRRAYFERRLASLGQTGPQVHTIGLVAEASGTIVGLVMGTLTHGEFGFTQVTALVDSIAVRPDHQRRGIGRQLASAFLAESAAQGASEVYTLVNWNAWDMLKFFDSLGFALAATVPLRRQIGHMEQLGEASEAGAQRT